MPGNVRGASRGKAAAGSKAGRSKKKRSAEDALLDDDRAGFFLGDDAPQAASGGPGEDGDGEEEQPEETAEEVRLRIAKAYLQQLKEGQQRDQEDEEFVGVTGGDEAGEDALAARLHRDALEAMGHYTRKLADRLQLPPLSPASSSKPAGRLLRGHRLAPTALALASDDATAFSVSKDGGIMRWDVETGKGTRLQLPHGGAPEAAPAADWVNRADRAGNARALLACAVSSSGQYLAVGGGDKKVHIFDARSGQHLRAHGGHTGAVSCLAFREGTHTLMSGSYDRTVKIWNVDERMYVDTLYGHQSEVISLDVARGERAVSGGYDHSCRVWKIPEESQLVFRSPDMAVEAVQYVSGGEWLSGGGGGSLCLWSSMKKKPVWCLRGAHAGQCGESGEALGAGSVGGDTCSWVTAVAACRGSDLVGSGSGDGVVRLWKVAGAPGAGGRHLEPLGGLPARGFVNGLQIARSGRFVAAALGQEPRLGRWVRDKVARNGVLIAPLPLADAAADGSDADDV